MFEFSEGFPFEVSFTKSQKVRLGYKLKKKKNFETISKNNTSANFALLNTFTKGNRNNVIVIFFFFILYVKTINRKYKTIHKIKFITEKIVIKSNVSCKKIR